VADGDGEGPGRTPGPGAAAPGAGAPALVVDPRMRSRRIHVRRSAGRRRLKRVTLVLAGMAIVVLALAATRTPLLDVDRVLVTGVDGARADAVRSAAAVAPDQPLVSLDTGAVASRVEALPWVASAQVSRSWPATVRVRVTEREVVAAVQVTDAHVALVDVDGYVVAIEQGAVETPDGGDDTEAGGDGAVGGDAAGALVLTGIEGPVAEGRRLDGDARDALTVAVAAAERMPDTVASVSTDLDAELVAGGVVRFGSTENLDEKITAVKTVLSDVDTACMAVLDVRVPGSPALTRNQGCP
jgi:POTRA domain, FtsQ-type